MTSDYAMLYMINHVFLPPKLPNGDDFNVKHDMMLLDTAIDVLTQFGACIMPNDSGCISTMIQTVQNMKKHHSVHTDGAIDQELLVNSFRDLCVDGILLCGLLRLSEANDYQVERSHSTYAHRMLVLSLARSAPLLSMSKSSNSPQATMPL